ncbi:hypothetical protein [Streptomyces sp. MAR25Y5]|uniref:hypothetical protein n=1 Tax=Streptomyces sp. MAR25Y5 TaxID=2962028 RepID=UPI0020B6DA95|nr:hypothetical protein [Streptomyces sp. MAR25Y5]MCP3770067.1 hypothetical protein [Streptomyces sp. MAR25Y5]
MAASGPDRIRDGIAKSGSSTARVKSSALSTAQLRTCIQDELLGGGFAADVGTAYPYVSPTREPLRASAGSRTEEHLMVLTAPSS